MTDNWHSLLQKQQSLLNKDITQSVSTAIPLPNLGMIQVEGDDAKDFLQNLVTNDVNALSINQSQFAGLCNPKGRLLGVFLIIRQQSKFTLVLPKSMAASIVQRLSMYILRSKVNISDVSGQLVGLGLIDPSVQLSLPSEDFNSVDENELCITKLPSVESDRYIALTTAEEAINLIENNNLDLGHESYWQLQDITAGLPMIVPQTKEAFTSQQVNLDLVNGVSFKKGCYPGQEIVARLHYLGNPSRRMFVARVDSELNLTEGQDINTTDGTIAGQIVNTVAIGGQTKLLVSLKLADYQSDLVIDGNKLTLETEDIPS